MALIQITVTDNTGTVVYNETHSSRYSVSSLTSQVRTKVSYKLRVDVETLAAEGFEIGNAANSAHITGSAWVQGASAANDAY